MIQTPCRRSDPAPVTPRRFRPHPVGLFVGLLLLCTGLNLAAPDAAGDGAGLTVHEARPAVAGQPTLQGLPPRPARALSGTDFARRTAGMTDGQRQDEATAEILRGNVPGFQRTLIPVELSSVLADGAVHRATLWVTPDYLAIGSDTDFLRMPLTLPAIARICDHVDALPPTPRMVDAIWGSARRLRPAPMPPGPQMRSTAYLLKHRLTISHQLPQAAWGNLVAGHKKDLVLTKRLALKPGRIAIYGWHQIDGEPIQPLSTIHGATYADYSHGLRLVAGTLLVDGTEHRLRDVLTDPFLSPLISDEGPLGEPRRLLHGTRG